MYLFCIRIILSFGLIALKGSSFISCSMLRSIVKFRYCKKKYFKLESLCFTCFISFFLFNCVLSFFLLLLFLAIIEGILHYLYNAWFIHSLCVLSVCFLFFGKWNFIDAWHKEVNNLSDTKMWITWKITKWKLKKVTIMLYVFIFTLIQSIKITSSIKLSKVGEESSKILNFWCRGLFWGFFMQLFFFYCLCIILVAGSCFLKRKLASLLITFFERKRTPLY